MSDVSKAAQDVAGRAEKAAGDALDDRGLQAEDAVDQAKAVAADTVDRAATSAADAAGEARKKAAGKGPLLALGATAVALGATWLAYRIAKASVKRHPAVRVARAGLHVVRDQRAAD